MLGKALEAKINSLNQNGAASALACMEKGVAAATPKHDTCSNWGCKNIHVAHCYHLQLLASVCLEPSISNMHSTHNFNFKHAQHNNIQTGNNNTLTHNTPHKTTHSNQPLAVAELLVSLEKFCCPGPGKRLPGLGKG